MCLQSGERKMHKRPAALALPEPGQFSREPQHSLPQEPRIPARSSLPEIFTFDAEALPTVSRAKPPRRHHTKRPRKVLYPSQTRRNRYLPPQERNPALRWLYILCLVVFVQVCLEEGDEATFSLQGQAPSHHGLSSALQGRASSLQDQLVEGPAAAMKELLQKPVSMPEHASVLLGSPSVLQEQASQPLNLTCLPLGRLLLTF